MLSAASSILISDEIADASRDGGGNPLKFAHSCGQQMALWSHCGIEFDVHRNDSLDLLNLVFANAD